ncbi:MAG: DUF1330 domain-containing protein [Acidobacteriota bacterium]
MPAYIVVNVEISDPVRYEEYRRLVAPTLEAYGGRYLVRGGQVEVLEGEWTPQRFVVVEFPSLEQAKAWWRSPEYAGPKAIRQASAHTDMIVVEGIPPRTAEA